MSLRVFKDWEANPLVDLPAFRISDARASEHLAAGTHFIVTCADGRKAIQAFPPPEEVQHFAQFKDAWRQKLSGCMPVWQMVTA